MTIVKLIKNFKVMAKTQSKPEEKEDVTVVGATEVPTEVKDDVIGAGADYSSAETEPKKIDDSKKEDKDFIKEDEKVKESVTNGEAGALTAAEASVLQKPVVADLVTGKPVYESAHQAMLAQSISGKLVTPNE